MRILHVQTHAGNIHVSCWNVVVSGCDLSISVVTTVVSGLMLVAICLLDNSARLHAFP